MSKTNREQMSNMVGTYQGVIAQIKNEGKTQWINKGITEGIKEGERNIILRLLETHTLEEVANLLKMETSEILNKIESKK
jgi:flagellar biosynthesis/type III secretory pathway protein FliH